MDPQLSKAIRQAALGEKVQKAGVLTADDDLFTVVGQVLITLIYGEVTTVMDGGASTVKLNEKTSSIDLCAATTITSDAAGEIYMLGGDAGAVVNGADAPTLKVGQLAGTPLTPILFGLGNGALGSLTIESTQTGADTGEILWSLFYIPMEDGAYVEAAA